MSKKNESFNIYHEAAEAALDNAKDWLNLAQYTLESGVTGHAISLAIIANEEIAKAYGCYVVAEGIIPKGDPEFKALFRDHYVKTEQMLVFYLMSTLGTHFQMGLVDADEFLKNVLESNPKDILSAEQELEKQIQKEARRIQRQRTQGMYIGIRKKKNRIVIKKPKNVKKNTATSSIQTVKDYHELVSVIVKTIRNHPKARKFFKVYLELLIKENRKTATITLES